jgi:hypothetical protein
MGVRVVVGITFVRTYYVTEEGGSWEGSRMALTWRRAFAEFNGGEGGGLVLVWVFDAFSEVLARVGLSMGDSGTDWGQR